MTLRRTICIWSCSAYSITCTSTKTMNKSGKVKVIRLLDFSFLCIYGSFNLNLEHCLCFILVYSLNRDWKKTILSKSNGEKLYQNVKRLFRNEAMQKRSVEIGIFTNLLLKNNRW